MKKIFLVLVLGIMTLNQSKACLSGGEGSTSCTHTITVGPVSTSSSISCGPGYYACCNGTSSSCKPNPPKDTPEEG